jgi:hypothetical protein
MRKTDKISDVNKREDPIIHSSETPAADLSTPTDTCRLFCCCRSSVFSHFLKKSTAAFLAKERV